MKAKLVLLMILLVAMMGCNALEDETLSGTRLLIQSIMGKGIDGAESNVIYSDVQLSSGGIVNDDVSVSVSAQPLDPYNAAPTYYQNIVIDQVDVKFSRTTGGSVEGKDVPYGFSTPLSVYVAAGDTDTVFNVTVITHNAKMEAPLIDLRDLGQEVVLALNAKLTFHAKDMAGKRLEPVSRTVTIYCANFADVVSKEE